MKRDIFGSEELQAAEDYRRQRQAAEAQRRGSPTAAYLRYLEWFENNDELANRLAVRAGASEAEAPAVVERIKKTLAALPETSDLDDLASILILSYQINRIQYWLGLAEETIRSGVVFGIAPQFIVDAHQRPVPDTDVSIIEVTRPFLTLCDLVSQLLAHTIESSFEGGRKLQDRHKLRCATGFRQASIKSMVASSMAKCPAVIRHRRGAPHFPGGHSSRCRTVSAKGAPEFNRDICTRSRIRPPRA